MIVLSIDSVMERVEVSGDEPMHFKPIVHRVKSLVELQRLGMSMSGRPRSEVCFRRVVMDFVHGRCGRRCGKS